MKKLQFTRHFGEISSEIKKDFSENKNSQKNQISVKHLLLFARLTRNVKLAKSLTITYPIIPIDQVLKDIVKNKPQDFPLFLRMVEEIILALIYLYNQKRDSSAYDRLIQDETKGFIIDLDSVHISISKSLYKDCKCCLKQISNDNWIFYKKEIIRISKSLKLFVDKIFYLLS